MGIRRPSTGLAPSLARPGEGRHGSLGDDPKTKENSEPMTVFQDQYPQHLDGHPPPAVTRALVVTCLDGRFITCG